MDLASGSIGDGTVTWQENLDGEGTVWFARTLDDDFYGAFAVLTSDLDRDESPDIVASAYGKEGIVGFASRSIQRELRQASDVLVVR